MKICFLARPSFDVYSTELFKKLKEKDSSIEGVFITSNGTETSQVKKFLQDYDSYEIFETSAYLKEHWEEFSLEMLINLENKYECSPIWEYIYSDRFLIHREYDYTVKIAAGLFSFYEYVFGQTCPDYYYSECIATLQCYAGYLVGKKLKVIYLTQMCARGSLDSTFHYFTMDPYQYNADLDNNYLEQEYSEEEKQKADEYLTDFENKDIIPSAMKLVKTKPALDKNFFLAPIRYLKRRFDSRLNDPYSYMYYKSYKDQLNPIIYYFRYHIIKKDYQKPDYNMKYVYYPLHFQPEASTCICAEKYEKQLFFIDSWAKSLPADTVLYVKEHYTKLGHRELDFYKKLKQYPNVFLINPWENSRELILNSVAVATLTGTAGLEAMLLRKPVFIGGNSVYENAPGVMKVTDIYDKYVTLIRNWTKPSREDVIKYLCACFKSYHKGNIYSQTYHQLLADNIDDIASSLYNKILSLQE